MELAVGSRHKIVSLLGQDERVARDQTRTKPAGQRVTFKSSCDIVSSEKHKKFSKHLNWLMFLNQINLGRLMGKNEQELSENFNPVSAGYLNKCPPWRKTYGWLIRLIVTYLLVKNHISTWLCFKQYQNANEPGKFTPLEDHFSSEWLKLYFGQLFLGQPDMALIFHTGSSHFLFFNLLILPRLYGRLSDFAFIKFIVLPEQEFRRIDEVVWHQISAVENSICNHYLYNREKRKSTESLEIVARLMFVMKREIAEFKGKSAHFWPKSYAKYSNHRWISARFRDFTHLKLTVAIIALVTYCIIILSAYLVKCQLSYVDECSFSQVFDWGDIWSSVDIAVTVVFCILIVLLQIILLSSALNMQIGLVHDLNETLQEAINSSRSFRCVYSAGIESESFLEMTEELLLKTIVQVRVLRNELALVASGLSNVFSIFTFTVPAILLLNFLVRYLEIKAHFLSTTLMFGWSWSFSNLTFLMEARINARLQRLQRLYWSLMNENLHRLSQRQMPQDFLSDSWMRMIMDKSNNTKRSTARVSGIDLRYERIFEINFYAGSLVALWWIHNNYRS